MAIPDSTRYQPPATEAELVLAWLRRAREAQLGADLLREPRALVHGSDGIRDGVLTRHLRRSGEGLSVHAAQRPAEMRRAVPTSRFFFLSSRAPCAGSAYSGLFSSLKYGKRFRSSKLACPAGGGE